MRQLTSQAIDRIDAPSPSGFMSGYVKPRRAVVLRGLGQDWPVRRWTLDVLAGDFGALSVPVAQAHDGVVTVDPRRGVLRQPTLLRDYIAALQSGGRAAYLTARADELPDDFPRAAPRPRYCEGAPWHVSKFWLAGPGTVSAMHRDLADNLHSQVFGRKRFTLVDPRESACVYPNSLLASIPNGCRADIERPDLERFPRLAGVHLLVAELEPGDTLYIPRRWWHHARSVQLSFSVNHWWARGAWFALVKAADLFKRARGISR
jgi:[protein]-arginine 3-hydroxylase / protease